MTGPEVASTPQEDPAAPRASWRDSLAVYLQRRVLIVLLLGLLAAVTAGGNVSVSAGATSATCRNRR